MQKTKGFNGLGIKNKKQKGKVGQNIVYLMWAKGNGQEEVEKEKFVNQNLSTFISVIVCMPPTLSSLPSSSIFKTTQH